MNALELTTMFPQVLDGSCPLPVFADACEDCGFDMIAKWFRRAEDDEPQRLIAVSQAVACIMWGNLLRYVDDPLAPKIKINLPMVIHRFRDYFGKNPAWGSLHVCVEEGNVHDDHVRWCIDRAEERGDVEGKELAQLLLLMSKTQRSKMDKLVQRMVRVERERDKALAGLP